MREREGERAVYPEGDVWRYLGNMRKRRSDLKIKRQFLLFNNQRQLMFGSRNEKGSE